MGDLKWRIYVRQDWASSCSLADWPTAYFEAGPALTQLETKYSLTEKGKTNHAKFLRVGIHGNSLRDETRAYSKYTQEAVSRG